MRLEKVLVCVVWTPAVAVAKFPLPAFPCVPATEAKVQFAAGSLIITVNLALVAPISEAANDEMTGAVLSMVILIMFRAVSLSVLEALTAVAVRL